MNRFRFSMASFLGLLTWLALGLAAMVSQSAAAANLAYTVFLALLGLATAMAVLSGSRQRAFCTGFAIFGWLYWFTEFEAAPAVAQQSSPAIGYSASRPEAEAAPGLITRQLLSMIEAKITSHYKVGDSVIARWAPGRYLPATIVGIAGDQYEVEWIDDGVRQWMPGHLVTVNSPGTRVAGHSLLGSLFALVGGVLTALFAGGRQAPADKDSPKPEGTSR